MAKTLEKQKALAMRAEGMSYSQIKGALGVSKSSLSLWLREYPLSAERVSELRAKSPQRIERFRNTMSAKREAVLDCIYEEAGKAIGQLSDRDIFIAGLFLYWGEGDKKGDTFSVSNTDPNVIRFFMKWARALGVPEHKFSVVLHLYIDMNERQEQEYWSKITGVPLARFTRSYIKKSTLVGLTYKNGFRHGTCMVRVFDRYLARSVLMGIKYIGDTQV
jgi:hypothetical protein